MRRSAFGVRRSAFSVQRLPFGVQRLSGAGGAVRVCLFEGDKAFSSHTVSVDAGCLLSLQTIMERLSSMRPCRKNHPTVLPMS
jgi:hypothetical protein